MILLIFIWTFFFFYLTKETKSNKKLNSIFYNIILVWHLSNEIFFVKRSPFIYPCIHSCNKVKSEKEFLIKIIINLCLATKSSYFQFVIQINMCPFIRVINVRWNFSIRVNNNENKKKINRNKWFYDFNEPISKCMFIYQAT